MNMAFSTNTSRGDVLAQTRQLLETLVKSVPAEAMPEYAAEVLAAWDARLRVAGELSPSYVLSSEVTGALSELRASLDKIQPESLIDWIDLIGQNVLDMVDIQPVAVHTEALTRTECGPSNPEPTKAADWGHSGNNQSAFAAAA